MPRGAVEPERDEQGTDGLVVASLFAHLERICADGSWELPEPAEGRGAAERGPRSRFWQRR